MDTAGTLTTAAELFSMPDDGYRYELVQGEVRRMTPAGGEHGTITVNLAMIVGQFIKTHCLGAAFGAETGFKIGSNPDTVRALFEAMRAVEGIVAASPAAAGKPAFPQSGAGSRWSAEEEERLAGGFDAGKTVDELAHAHNRSRAAIEARLVRLGKMDASAVTSPLRYPPKPAGQPAPQGG